MFINPSAHTVVPRTRLFQGRTRRRTWRPVSIPGGKQLCFAVAKVACGVGLLLFLSSLWLGSSIRQVNAEISRIESQHEQLVNANVLMRAKKAHLFSPEAVGALAGDQLAIHLPESGQYKKF